MQVDCLSLILSNLGVMAQYKEDIKNKPPNEQYIQMMHSERSDDGSGEIEVVVTMHPELAKYIHTARYSAHDTTYKRIKGSHNEWEVVIWSERLKRRMFPYTVHC